MKEEVSRKLVLTYTPRRGKAKSIEVQMRIPDMMKEFPITNFDDPNWRTHAQNTDPITDKYVEQMLWQLNRYIRDLVVGAEFHVEEVKVKTTWSHVGAPRPSYI